MHFKSSIHIYNTTYKVLLKFHYITVLFDKDYHKKSQGSMQVINSKDHQ